MKTECDFIRERAGTRNWVVACRSPRIIHRYGADVVCFSPKAYSKLMDEYATYVEGETVNEIAASCGLSGSAIDALRLAYRAGRAA